MTDGMRIRGWVVAVAGGVLVAGLGAFLAVRGLDEADRWASVFGLFVGLVGLILAVAGAVGAARRVGAQTVTDSAVGGGVSQVSGVRGSARIGSGAAPAAVPPRPAASIRSSVPPPEAGGQSVTRSSTLGRAGEAAG